MRRGHAVNHGGQWFDRRRLFVGLQKPLRVYQFPTLTAFINVVGDTKHTTLSLGGTPPLMCVSYFWMGANGYWWRLG